MRKVGVEAPPEVCLERARPLKNIRRALFGDDPVCPFHERDEDRGAAELRSTLIQVCFRDATRPGAGPSREDRNVFCHNFLERLAQRRPAHRHDRIDRRLAHQIRGFPHEENLHLVPGLGKR